MAIDIHCHINDEAYYNNSVEYSSNNCNASSDIILESKINPIDDVDGIIANFPNNNIDKVIVSGWDRDSSCKALELALKHERVYLCAGIQPENVKNAVEGDLIVIENILDNPKCVALGEIGLDYHWTSETKELQKKYFIAQLEIAKKKQVPVVIHKRDAEEDTMEILLRYYKDIPSIILHCYSGSIEFTDKYIEMGCYFSFGGTSTFKNAKKVVRAINQVPLEKILTETDSPYLTPHPYRGKRNEPKFVNLVVKKLAELRGMKLCDAEDRFMQNISNAFLGKI